MKAIDPIYYSLTTNGSIYLYRAYRYSGWTSISPSSISAINSSIPTSSSIPSSSQTSITSNRWLVLYFLIKTPSYIPINETFQAFLGFYYWCIQLFTIEGGELLTWGITLELIPGPEVRDMGAINSLLKPMGNQSCVEDR